MRDVSDFDAIPSLAEIHARIRDPDRFRPEPRVVGKATLDVLPDGYGMLTLEGRSPRRIHPMVVEAHRALVEGEPFTRIVDRAMPLWEGRRRPLVDRVLRTYVAELWEAGFVELPFEEPPAVFAGRYERVDLVGRGGHGVIHLCRDLKRDGELVVVKHAIGWETRIDKSDRVARVEAVALARCDHELVPKLHDTFEIDGIFHLVREFVDGRPLTSVHRAGMPDEKRFRIGRDVCLAIDHLHSRGMIYLDMKLENFIHSERDGRTRLLDLGLCRPAEGDVPVQLRKPIGTRAYVAPEVFSERQATVRSDVYGVGRALFMLATGERPRQKWTGADLARMMRERGRGEREVALVARLAADDPMDRPADLKGTVAELEAMLAEAGPDPVAP